jgi:hypothetical protein
VTVLAREAHRDWQQRDTEEKVQRQAHEDAIHEIKTIHPIRRGRASQYLAITRQLTISLSKRHQRSGNV